MLLLYLTSALTSLFKLFEITNIEFIAIFTPLFFCHFNY